MRFSVAVGISVYRFLSTQLFISTDVLHKNFLGDLDFKLTALT